MTAMISSWGNSQGLRFPKKILEELHLSVGDTLDIQIEDEKIILQAIKQPKIKYDINQLVAKMPQDYKVCEVFDTTVGLEEW